MNLEHSINNLFKGLSDEQFSALLEKSNFDFHNQNGLNFVSPNELDPTCTFDASPALDVYSGSESTWAPMALSIPVDLCSMAVGSYEEMPLAA